MQGSVSQICYLGLSSNFMTKKREDLAIFFIKDFLHLIKFKLGHKYKILRHASLHSDLLYMS